MDKRFLEALALALFANMATLLLAVAMWVGG